MNQDQVPLTEREMIEIDVTIEQLETAVAKRDKLQQLQSLPLFKEVILTGYMEDNAVRLVHLIGSSQMQDDYQQKSLNEQIKSIGLLGEWFRAIYAMGDQAEKQLEDYSQELTNTVEEELS